MYYFHNYVFNLSIVLYYAIIGFITALSIGTLLENDTCMPYCFKSYDFSKSTLTFLFFDLLKDIIIYIIVFFTIKNVLKNIPMPLIQINKLSYSYVETGVNIGVGIIFFQSIGTMFNKISEFNKKIKKKLEF